MAAMYAGAPQYDFCNAGDPGKLCDLLWNVIAVEGRNICARLFRHVDMLLQALFVLRTHPVGIRCFDIQRSKRAAECLCHCCRRPHDLCIGGRGRQTRQNMFSGWVVLIHKDHLPCPQYSTI